MLTTWEYSVKSEAERLVHTAHQIIIGFYKANNFVVLSDNPKSSNTQTVVFPLLPYNQISRFWEQIKMVNISNLPVEISDKLIVELSNLLTKSNLKRPEFEKTKLLWEKAESEVLEEIYKIVPSKKDKIKKIIIYPTIFGTGGSFNLLESNGEVIIHLREDKGIHNITEAIVTSLTRQDIYTKLDGLWSESEIISDYLVTETSIANVLAKYEKAESYIPTIKGVRGKDHLKLVLESDELYKKLGIPEFSTPFSKRESTPLIFDKPITNLSETEKKLIILFIDNENKIIDFDQIGEVIFKTNDDFSLYAISKSIQRLRDKFETNGISGSYIQTLRGKGYMLRN